MLIALLSLTSVTLVCMLIAFALWLRWRHRYAEGLQYQQQIILQKMQYDLQQYLSNGLSTLRLQLSEQFGDFQNRFSTQQLTSLKTLQESLQSTLLQTREELSKRVEALTQNTDVRLKEIAGHVEKRLAEGFEKTTEAFHDVVKRLALIDQAQQKITELSTNVVSLQEILADKRSRGAFGEVQMVTLIRNVLPESSFSLQYTLSNQKRADCVLFLPEPTGMIAIDAKFPLESYQLIQNAVVGSTDRLQAERQFKRDIQKHIRDVSEKYIIQGETTEGAMLFIPAESVFAEIHGFYPELVAMAQKLNVWLVSPTTMMAVLTTARAVLKDEATRRQVHIIRDHLARLAEDFKRFELRMDDVRRHIGKAYENVEKVHISAKKISSRFEKIEAVEMQGEEKLAHLLNETDD